MNLRALLTKYKADNIALEEVEALPLCAHLLFFEDAEGLHVEALSRLGLINRQLDDPRLVAGEELLQAGSRSRANVAGALLK